MSTRMMSPTVCGKPTADLSGWCYRRQRPESCALVVLSPKWPFEMKGLWGGRWELNPQRPEPQSGALPVELLPPRFSDYSKFGPYLRIRGRGWNFLVSKMSERLSNLLVRSKSRKRDARRWRWRV